MTGRSICTWPGRRDSYLRILMFHVGEELRRENVLGVFWGDRPEAKARSTLNTSLWRIKHTLRSNEIDALHIRTDSQSITLCDDKPIDLDTENLNTASAAALDIFDHARDTAPVEEVTAVKETLDTCSGTFLEGMDNEWILAIREQLLNRYIRGQSALMLTFSARTYYEHALGAGRRILAIDPTRETIQRHVMWLYAMSGQRAKAVRQFRFCERLLAQELGISPMLETVELYKLITSDYDWSQDAANIEGLSRSDRRRGLERLESVFAYASNKRHSMLSRLLSFHP